MGVVSSDLGPSVHGEDVLKPGEGISLFLQHHGSVTF